MTTEKGPRILTTTAVRSQTPVDDTPRIRNAIKAMRRNKYLYIAIAWTVVGLGVLVIDYALGLQWFAVRLSKVPISFGWLILVLAGLNLYLHLKVQAHLRLTPAEIMEYWERLEAATPDILAMVSRHVNVREIAARMEEERSIPRLVTLKFLIALGDAQRRGVGVTGPSDL